MLVLLSSDSYSYANSLPSLLDVDTVVTEDFAVRAFFGAAAANGITGFYKRYATGLVSVC